MEPRSGVWALAASSAGKAAAAPQAVSARALDLALATAALRGERDALAALVERLGCVPRILAAKNQRLGAPLSAEELTDLVQEVLSRVWDKLPRFRGESVLESWIYPFCVLELLNALRRKRGTSPLRREALEDERSSEEPAWEESDFDSLYQGLEKLAAPQATSIRLRWFHGASFEEIGARLSMPVSSAKTHYYRGMERLRALLVPHLRGAR